MQYMGDIPGTCFFTDKSANFIYSLLNIYMVNFKHSGSGRFDNKRGGSRFSGRDDRRSDFQRGPASMHQAICSACGKACEVPFRPSGDKPVYCNDCFGGKKNAGFDSFARKDFSVRAPAERPVAETAVGNNDVNRQLQAINVKLEKLIQIADALVRVKNSEQKEVVKSAPVVQQEAIAKKAPVKKKSTTKTGVKKVTKKTSAKKGKK